MKVACILETSLGPASLVWFEPGAPRYGAPSQDVTTILLFLGVFTVFLVLSIATLNYIGRRREKKELLCLRS